MLLSSKGFDDLVARAEYLKRIQGIHEAVVGRVRELRNQAKRTVDPPARRATNRIEAARDAIAAQEQALAAARASVESRQAELVAARGRARVAALAEIRNTEQELDGVGRRDPEQDRGQIAGGLGVGAAAGWADPERPAPRASSGRSTARSSPASAGASGPRSTRGSTSPCRTGTPIRAAAVGHRDLHRARAEQRRLRQLHLHRPRRRALHLLRPPGRPSRSPPGQQVSQGQVIGYIGLHRLLLRARTCTSRSASTERRRRPDGLPLARPRESGGVAPRPGARGPTSIPRRCETGERSAARPSGVPAEPSRPPAFRAGDGFRPRRLPGPHPLSRRLVSSQRSASPWSSGSCWTERWWPPGTTISFLRLGGPRVDLARERDRDLLVARRRGAGSAASRPSPRRLAQIVALEPGDESLLVDWHLEPPAADPLEQQRLGGRADRDRPGDRLLARRRRGSRRSRPCSSRGRRPAAGRPPRPHRAAAPSRRRRRSQRATPPALAP